jgi:hypothetical protein
LHDNEHAAAAATSKKRLGRYNFNSEGFREE